MTPDYPLIGIHPELIATLNRWITEKSGFHYPLHVLDVGTGFGQTIQLLLAHPKVSEITSIDPSATAIASVQSQLAKATSRISVQFRQASAEQLPFPSATFPLIIAGHTLHHVTARAQAIQEMIRVTTPKGWIIITEWIPGARVPDHHPQELLVTPYQIRLILQQLPFPLNIAEHHQFDPSYVVLIRKSDNPQYHP